MRVTLLAALFLAGVDAPARGGDDAPKAVTLRTQDGMELQADWYPGEAGMPGVVALHMYRQERSTWKPLAEARPRGYGFLAVDMRGHGGSKVQGGKDLSERVEKRDVPLFSAMWQDAAAAVKWLRTEGKCDPKRIGIVGASVGCSVAIDAAVRDPSVMAVACMTPGKEYLGVPTMEHVKSFGKRPILLLSSEEEKAGGAVPIAEALKDDPECELRVVPGKEIHGARMFGKVAEIEARLASWLRAALGRQVLDGRVDPCEVDGTPMNGFSATIEPDTGDMPIYSFRLGIDAGGVNLSGQAPEGKDCPPALELRFDPAAPGDGDPPDGARRLRGEASGEGTLLRAWLDVRKDGKWVERPLGQLAGVAIVRGRVLEARIPWRTLEVARGTQVWMGLKIGKQTMPVGGSLEVPE